MPIMRCRQYPGSWLGPHHLRLDLLDPGRVKAAGPFTRRSRARARDRRHDGDCVEGHAPAGELSMWKGCAFAFAARNGVFAALLAADGMTGPAPLFEGEMGFFQQVSGPFSLPKLGGATATDWMLPKTSIKFVPAEYHSQSAIAAAFALKQNRRSSTDSRDRNRDLSCGRRDHRQDPEKWRPRTRETADHSLPYCTAVALVDGEITAKQFTPERLRDPELIELVSRTRVVEDAKLTAGYPAGIPNRVTITLNDGTKLTEEVAFPPGHDKNPLTDAQLAQSFTTWPIRSSVATTPM